LKFNNHLLKKIKNQSVICIICFIFLSFSFVLNGCSNFALKTRGEVDQDTTKEFTINKGDKLFIDRWVKPGETFKPIYNNIYNDLLYKYSEINTGDVILRLSAYTECIGIAISSFGGFSHSGIILRDNNDIYVVDVHPSREKISKIPLRKWLSLEKIIQARVFRLKNINSSKRRKIRNKITNQIGKSINFGIEEDYYCSGFVYKLLQDYMPNKDLIRFKNFIINVYRNLEGHLDYSVSRYNLHRIKEELAKKKDVLNGLHEQIIPPTFFEWSNSFETKYWGYIRNINDFKTLLDLYKYTSNKILALHALNSRSKKYTSTSQIKSIFSKYKVSDGDIDYINSLIIQNSWRNKFNSQELVFELMKNYANMEASYDLILKGLKDAKIF